MRHIIICREYPPAPSGGIGTYVLHISRLLAERGETVHVIGQLWEGAEKEVEELCERKLIIHRVPFADWKSIWGKKPSPAIKSNEARRLFDSSFPPQCFSWQASLLAEKLVDEEGIDIIEAQEFEAPLYFFQLRRALGLGPKRRPPCLIHLHSPMEFIARHNCWDINHVYLRTAARLERYCIATADALLCPSRYLASQAEINYGLADGSVQVIPLPSGDSPLIERNTDTWEHGTILYVGRLEPRKGVIEWIDAAVSIAREYPTAYFEFVGANILGTHRMSSEEFVKQRIPIDLRARFLFRGEQKRASLPKFLSGARIAVVPSRWENFPNTCVEAMCSGIPVIASREGGMTEMIADGRTGWLAYKIGSEGLTEALRRALGTPPTRLAEMGYEASRAIRLLCDNNKIVERQLNFRAKIVNRGANRSICLPVNLPWIRTPLHYKSVLRNAKDSSREGIAVVITASKRRKLLDQALHNLHQQTRKPATIVVVTMDKGLDENLANKAMLNGWLVIENTNAGIISAKNAAIEVVLRSGSNPLGFAFLGTNDRLGPGFLAQCESVLQQCPEIGLVSCWANNSEIESETFIRPCPSFPFQWISSEAVPFSVVRTEALIEAGKFRSSIREGYESWDLFNAVMAAGWIAVTVPEILAHYPFVENSIPQNADGHIHVRMRQELLERFPELVARDAKDIILLAESDKTWSPYLDYPKLLGKLILAEKMLRSPRRAAFTVLKKTKDRILQNAPGWMSNLISRH